ncbi:hypothetical protein GYK56_000080 [Listeria monocytogenes]|uniref:Uncharacterized protein n=1 Tax=Listeria monocytogenes TaxID=1639 RepID=A0A6C8EP29_LISMN|nr:hypothetical protein [Listeria monocytogenes]EDN9312203.1 hypothetical protein [Listeria monocytogenes]EDN9321311.1 hypothetical protein [Listeria monocytogenes]EDN9330145.1 hypothetical protein [Listeria monocytogenes]EDN9335799.1 hypothetical protein [Listeria monocytogenes]
MSKSQLLEQFKKHCKKVTFIFQKKFFNFYRDGFIRGFFVCNALVYKALSIMLDYLT